MKTLMIALLLLLFASACGDSRQSDLEYACYKVGNCKMVDGEPVYEGDSRYPEEQES